MSVHVMNLVWKKAPYQGNTLLTLLALADWSNDDGMCWPSIPVLAKKSRQSERNCYECVSRLEREGMLKISPRDGTSNLFTIDIAQLDNCKDCTPAKSSRGGVRSLQKNASDPCKEQHQTPAKTAPNTPIVVDTPITSDTPNTDTSGNTRLASLDSQPSAAVSVVGNTETNTSSKEENPEKRAVRWLFDYYIQKTKRKANLYSLTDKRERMCLARLEEVRKRIKAKPGELREVVLLAKKAIDNMLASDWHQQNNQIEWEYVFRSAEKFEQKLNLQKVVKRDADMDEEELARREIKKMRQQGLY